MGIYRRIDDGSGSNVDFFSKHEVAEAFGFEGGEKAFHRGVVVRTSGPAHAGLCVMAVQEAAEVCRRLLAPRSE